MIITSCSFVCVVTVDIYNNSNTLFCFAIHECFRYPHNFQVFDFCSLFAQARDPLTMLDLLGELDDDEDVRS